MEYQNFSELLKLYLDAKITKAQFIELKRLSVDISNKQLEDILEQMWLSYDKTSIAKFKNLDLYPPKIVVHKLRWRASLRMAVAAILIPIVLLTVYYINDNVGSEVSPMAVVETANGEKAKITLPDGSIIHLNNATKVEYSTDFGKTERKILLNGEAYFDVAKNDGKDFVVQTSSIKIVVTGTSFNVSAYSNCDFTETALIKGEIEITSTKTPNNVVNLTANEKVVVDNLSGEIVKSRSDMIYETAWRQNELIFRSMSLSDIFKKLEVFYGQSIEVKGDVSDKLFTGRFKEEKITDALEILQMHYKFKYKFNNGNIIITSN